MITEFPAFLFLPLNSRTLSFNYILCENKSCWQFAFPLLGLVLWSDKWFCGCPLSQASPRGRFPCDWQHGGKCSLSVNSGMVSLVHTHNHTCLAPATLLNQPACLPLPTVHLSPSLEVLFTKGFCWHRRTHCVRLTRTTSFDDQIFPNICFQ